MASRHADAFTFSCVYVNEWSDQVGGRRGRGGGGRGSGSASGGGGGGRGHACAGALMVKCRSKGGGRLTGLNSGGVAAVAKKKKKKMLPTLQES